MCSDEVKTNLQYNPLLLLYQLVHICISYYIGFNQEVIKQKRGRVKKYIYKKYSYNKKK